MMMGNFIRVEKEEYTDYLKYLSENGGYTYKSVTVADCTLVYEEKDIEQKNKVGGRYFGGRPEIYEIREDKYSEFLTNKMKLALSNISKQTSSSGAAIGMAVKEFADRIRQEYGNL
jgi:hypothetical protein